MGKTKISYREAIRRAIFEEMQRDKDVFLMGEEVGYYEGAYKATQGLLKEFGEERVVDTPISEQGFAGVGIGAAMCGLRPIIEFMTWNFSLVAFDQLYNNAAKMFYMSGGQFPIPVTFRGPGGAGGMLAAQHSQALESLYLHCPGLKVVTPSTPHDALGLLKTSIRDNNPVVFIEGEVLYNVTGEVPEEEFLIPLGQADLKKEGKDFSIICWSRGYHFALEALDSGILLATLAEEGDRLPVGAPMGVLGEMGEEISDILEKAKKDLEQAKNAPAEEDSSGKSQKTSEAESSASKSASSPSSQSSESADSSEATESSGSSPADSDAAKTSAAKKESQPRSKLKPSADVRISSPEKPILDAPAQNGLIALPAHRILFKKSKANVRATPLARRIAKEKNLDLSLMEPTGRGGTITEDDVNEFQKTRPTGGGNLQIKPDRKVELSNMRKVIASRLHDAKNNIPHFYLTVEFNAESILKLRKSLNDDLAAMASEGQEVHKFSLNDLITRAVALSLQRHPVVNSSWREDHVLEHGNIDIGIAVAIDGGLITPYVRNADQISLMQLSRKAVDLVSRARSRKLKPDEFTNGTFTISNLGMFGIKEFSAIINEPEAALLAVGGIVDKPVVKDGSIIIEKTITMTLSCDHRVVDGAEGARFLQTLKGFIENPYNLIVGS